MQPISVEALVELLYQLPPDKLAIVYNFVATLSSNEPSLQDGEVSTMFRLMLVSEAVLRRDWDSPEEDAAWAHL